MMLRHDAHRHFRLKKRENLKVNLIDLKHSNNMNIVALYRGTSEFKKGYKSRNNLVKDFVGMEQSFFLSY